MPAPKKPAPKAAKPAAKADAKAETPKAEKPKSAQASAPKPDLKAKPAHPGQEQPGWARNQNHGQKMAKSRIIRHQGR